MGFFEEIKEKIETTVKEELQDLSYMEIITAVSDDVDKNIDAGGWDMLDSLRQHKTPAQRNDEKNSTNDVSDNSQSQRI